MFAAASLKNALDEAAAQWQRESGKKVAISYAASNTLIKQIEQGAPADMFISADLDWMDYGQQKGLIKPDTRSNLLGNRLVLVAPKDSNISANIQPGFDLAALLKGGRLAMGNVDAVPAGKYGKAALEKLGAWDGVKDKIAQAESVRAALVLVVARRGPARHRLPDRCGVRPDREDRRHLPREHASADHLSDRADERPRATRMRWRS